MRDEEDSLTSSGSGRWNHWQSAAGLSVQQVSSDRAFAGGLRPYTGLADPMDKVVPVGRGAGAQLVRTVPAGVAALIRLDRGAGNESSRSAMKARQLNLDLTSYSQVALRLAEMARSSAIG